MIGSTFLFDVVKYLTKSGSKVEYWDHFYERVYTTTIKFHDKEDFEKYYDSKKYAFIRLI